jgi:luciferase family oxidoreductase group 1
MEATALRRYRDAPTNALQRDDFPDQLSELIAFLHRDFPAQHPFSRVLVAPDAPGAPDVWLLGSSLWSAQAAAEFGLPYAFAHFFSGDSTRPAIQHYQENFRGNPALGEDARRTPEAMAAVGVVCAETQAEAERLALSVRLLQLRIRQNDRRPVATPAEAAAELAGYGAQPPERTEFPRYFIGTPDKVRKELLAMTSSLGIHELVVNTITHDPAARLRSYSLLAEALALDIAA